MHPENQHVAVIVPLFNKGPYVERAIRSILSQTFRHFTVYVINDGSTDDGPARVRLLAESDQRVCIIDQSNCGLAATRNRGISESTAPLITFLDGDDEWDPEFLQRALATFGGFPSVGAVAIAYRVVQPSGGVKIPAFQCGVPVGKSGIIPDYFESLMLGPPPISACSIVIRREVFRCLGGFPPLRRGQDTAFWNPMVLKFQLAFLNLTSVTIHLDSDSTYRSAQRWVQVTTEDARFIVAPLDEALRSPSLSPSQAKWLRKYRNKRLLELIRQDVMCGSPELARQLYLLYGSGVPNLLREQPRLLSYLVLSRLPTSCPRFYWAFRHRLWELLAGRALRAPKPSDRSPV